jgi:hypothetical protein
VVRPKIRTRREPENSVLYQILAEHLETFLARARADETRGDLPRFVVRELRGFLECGILAHGFCRVRCTACGVDALVAFSCKGRGFCPSCGTRRMVDTAAWLVDRVLPEVAVRQWVLALPHRVRFLCAYDPELCRGVRRIFVRAVSSLYQRRARRRGIEEPRVGCVAFTQRFDSALRLNLHFHVLWPDGVFTCPRYPLDAPAEFHPAERPSEDDIARLAQVLRDRILRFLRKKGKLPDELDPVEPEHEQPLLATLAAAAVQGRSALGPKAGAWAERLGRGTARGGEFGRGGLCADSDGFSLHAGVRIPELCRERLEKLCRYAARPPVVHERMSLSADGSKVIYKLKRRYRDGSTHVVLDPLALIERLAALVPRPRVNLVTYHGVFAPAASYRAAVVPEPPESDGEAARASCPHAGSAAQDSDEHEPSRLETRRRYSWAELMKRVFRVDVLTCDSCGGRRKLLAFLTDPKAVVAILTHLGLPHHPPAVAAARSPPQAELPFF